MSEQHKMREVPDSVCEGCTQYWEGECRAFEMSHSGAEWRSRTVKRGCPTRLPCVVWQREGGRRSQPANEMDYGTILVLGLAVLVILMLVQLVP